MLFYIFKYIFKYIFIWTYFFMENLLTPLTASLTELREPNKVIAKAGNQPVAILNRNEAIGYLLLRQVFEYFGLGST